MQKYSEVKDYMSQDGVNIRVLVFDEKPAYYSVFSVPTELGFREVMIPIDDATSIDDAFVKWADLIAKEKKKAEEAAAAPKLVVPSERDMRKLKIPS